MTQPILIDTDPGIDDAMALLLAAASPELTLAGVTTVFGNGADVAMMTRNALAILALAERSDVPVAAGATQPLVRAYQGRGAAVHGDNGLGGVELPLAAREPERVSAPQLIVEAAHRHAGELILVTLAPLTNLALALHLEPDLPHLVKEVVMMGGAVNLPGNITPAAEANIYNDPEAARVVLNAGWPVVMAGLNVTCQVRIAEPFLDSLAALGNPQGRFINAAARAYLAFYRRQGEPGICMHDVHTVMVLLRPEFYEGAAVCVDVETQGELTQGQTVADWRSVWGKPAQTKLLTAVDADAFRHEFRRRIGAYAGVTAIS
jgi:purine nucleosidase